MLQAHIITPMELSDLAGKILSFDKNIRFVGIVGPQPEYRIVHSQMREGVKPLTPHMTGEEVAEREKFECEMISQIALGVAGQLEKDLGTMTLGTINYEKATLAFFRLKRYTVTMTIEPGIYVLPIVKRIKAQLER